MCVNENVNCLQKDLSYFVVHILAYLVVLLKGSVSAYSSLQTYQGFWKWLTAHLTPSCSGAFHKSNGWENNKYPWNSQVTPISVSDSKHLWYSNIISELATPKINQKSSELLRGKVIEDGSSSSSWGHSLAVIHSLEEGTPAGTRSGLKWWANSSVCEAREEIILKKSY